MIRSMSNKAIKVLKNLDQKLKIVAAVGFISSVLGIISFFSPDQDKKDIADELILEILSNPSAEYRSGINVINGFQESISRIAKDSVLKFNSQNNNDLDVKVDELIAQGYSYDDIRQKLIKSGGGEIQYANKKIQEISNRFDDIYKELAQCFRRRSCQSGEHFNVMCNEVQIIAKKFSKINSIVENTSGILYVSSGASPIFSDAPSNPIYKEVANKYVFYLATKTCK